MGNQRKRIRTRPAITTSRSTTPTDLLLLAGLPNPLHNRMQEFLKGLAGAYAKVIAVPVAGYDGPLYRIQTVKLLLQSAAGFSIRRLRTSGDNQSPQPRRIALFYVPATDDEHLISAFDFFVFPLPLIGLEHFDPNGHQKRHDPVECEQAIRTAFWTYTEELIRLLQPRIEQQKSSEPLLLPPRNFHLPERRLHNAFCELTRRSRTWQNAMPDGIVPGTFTHEHLPSFLKQQERQQIFRDGRDVLFPCARRSEYHAPPRDFPPDSDLPVLQDFLRSVYRFGIPLPDGFHHDAQLEGGCRFENMTFDCTRQGQIVVSGSHANIYPNDFVRIGA